MRGTFPPKPGGGSPGRIYSRVKAWAFSTTSPWYDILIFSSLESQSWLLGALTSFSFVSEVSSTKTLAASHNLSWHNDWALEGCPEKIRPWLRPPLHKKFRAAVIRPRQIRSPDFLISFFVFEAPMFCFSFQVPANLRYSPEAMIFLSSLSESSLRGRGKTLLCLSCSSSSWGSTIRRTYFPNAVPDFTTCSKRWAPHWTVVRPSMGLSRNHFRRASTAVSTSAPLMLASSPLSPEQPESGCVLSSSCRSLCPTSGALCLGSVSSTTCSSSWLSSNSGLLVGSCLLRCLRLLFRGSLIFSGSMIFTSSSNFTLASDPLLGLFPPLGGVTEGSLLGDPPPPSPYLLFVLVRAAFNFNILSSTFEAWSFSPVVARAALWGGMSSKWRALCQFWSAMAASNAFSLWMRTSPRLAKLPLVRWSKQTPRVIASLWFLTPTPGPPELFSITWFTYAITFLVCQLSSISSPALSAATSPWGLTSAGDPGTCWLASATLPLPRDGGRWKRLSELPPSLSSLLSVLAPLSPRLNFFLTSRSPSPLFFLFPRDFFFLLRVRLLISMDLLTQHSPDSLLCGGLLLLRWPPLGGSRFLFLPEFLLESSQACSCFVQSCAPIHPHRRNWRCNRMSHKPADSFFQSSQSFGPGITPHSTSSRCWSFSTLEHERAPCDHGSSTWRCISSQFMAQVVDTPIIRQPFSSVPLIVLVAGYHMSPSDKSLSFIFHLCQLDQGHTLASPPSIKTGILHDPARRHHSTRELHGVLISIVLTAIDLVIFHSHSFIE